MPLIQDDSPKSIQENVKRLMEEGKTQEQAIAIALEIAKKAKERKKK